MPISPYLASLRRRVGTDLIMVPAAVALITNEARDSLLMVELAGQARWGLPGGALEPDERPVDAVVRETREETGIAVSVDRLHDAYGGPTMRHTFPNGDEIQYLMVAYWCSIVDGQAEADGNEVVDARFVHRAELPELKLPPWAHTVVPDAFAALGSSRGRRRYPG